MNSEAMSLKGRLKNLAKQKVFQHRSCSRIICLKGYWNVFQNHPTRISSY